MRENDFKIKRYAFFILIIIIAIAMISSGISKKLNIDVFETSADGNSLKHLTTFTALEKPVLITVNPEKKFQTITGFGGSFTEASASLINELSETNREKIMKAYFSEEGANYSLTRTHINSCDFSLRNYAYANLPGDKSLSSFSIDEDKNDLIPMIKMAQKFSRQGFKIIASPWTAPPWMKDNNDWRGGKLLPEYRETWARYFIKYMEAYKKEGIDIWGITVENEPLGNDKNWESMHFSPEEMRDFVRDYLGPQLEKDGWGHVPILGYDQNRGEELEKWVKVLFEDKEAAKYVGGTAVHWYASTYDIFPKSLQYAANASPGKYLINTEACVDAQVPVWKNDSWYWNEEAKDWGWTWAPADQKYLHPKYVPVFRYARDIIGCLNNNVDGWIDWNMVLNKQGGPNWFKNWCTAPVIVDTALDEVYFTPLFYTMSHFSRFIRPGAVRIAFESADSTLMVTAAKNPDGSIAVIIFNPSDVRKSYSISLGKKIANAVVSSRAIQTIVIR
jgi:glucosylceramidase